MMPQQTLVRGIDISNTLTQRFKKFSGSMIKQSIKRRIVAIAVGLIILMLATSVLSMVMVGRVGHLLDELTARYTPANAHLTRMNILSLERALALRRMRGRKQEGLIHLAARGPSMHFATGVL